MTPYPFSPICESTDFKVHPLSMESLTLLKKARGMLGSSCFLLVLTPPQIILTVFATNRILPPDHHSVRFSQKGTSFISSITEAMLCMVCYYLLCWNTFFFYHLVFIKYKILTTLLTEF